MIPVAVRRGLITVTRPSAGINDLHCGRSIVQFAVCKLTRDNDFVRSRLCSANTNNCAATLAHCSRRQRFQAIFMMQPREDQGGYDLVATRNLIPVRPRERFA